MRIWIDATAPNSFKPFLGMTLLEYQLRLLLQSERQIRSLSKIQTALEGNLQLKRLFEKFLEADVRPTEVRVELPADAPVPSSIPEDLLSQLPIKWSSGSQSSQARLQAALEDSRGEPLVALSADSVVDVRVLEDFLWGGENRAYLTGTGAERAAMMRIDAPLSDGGGDLQSLAEIAEQALDQGTIDGPITPFEEEELQGWIGKLRRDLPPFLFQIPDDAARDRVEHFLFLSNYKGATDFMTRYVYPPIVWVLVKELARRRIHPNAVTSIGIVATFASLPLFAAGMWIPGLALAYLMSVLDSVDGKLARLTFTSTDQGDTLDHGLDIVHPPLWYFAWAWGLSGGDPYSPLIQASMWMFLLYMVDRILETLFKSSTGESIHGYRKIDVRMRTFISRRNPNLAIFTIALPLGLGAECFFFIVAWQAFCVLFHLSRVIKFWNAADEPGNVVSEA